MASALQELDRVLSQGFRDWNYWTVALTVLIILIACFPAFSSQEPDPHPLLLARQAAPSRVRHPRESAVYRSLDIPYGFPLRKSLPSKGRRLDGSKSDLRDVFAEASQGTGPASPLLAILGKQHISEVGFQQLGSQIGALGKCLRQRNAQRVAIYLSNTSEWLVALFACVYFGLEPVLIPPQQELDHLVKVLSTSRADILIAGAGTVSATDLAHGQLQEIVWVVTPSSRQLDWNERPNRALRVSVWHEILEKNQGQELSNALFQGQSPKLLFASGPVITEFDQRALVAAVSAQLAVLPRSFNASADHQLTSKDTVLSLVSLACPFALTITLAALYAKCTVALTPTTGPQVDFATAFVGIQPTILITHPETLAPVAEREAAQKVNIMRKLYRQYQESRLKNGTMPQGPKHLRLIYTFHIAGSNNLSLSAAQMIYIRLATRARIINALVTDRVMGAVCQSNLLDYDNAGRLYHQSAHFGPPLSCLEAKLQQSQDNDAEEEVHSGSLLVAGPAVLDGSVRIPGEFRLTASNTFATLH